MLKAYKYRIYPNKIQAAQIEQHFGCCRLVYNLGLEVKIRAWQGAQKNVSRYDLQKQLVDLKQEYSWLYDVNAQSLQSQLLNLDNAYKKFFTGGGFPKFKKRNGYNSFQCPQRVKLIDGKLKIPLIDNIKIELSREFKGIIKTVTISRTPTGKYFASILVDNQKELPKKKLVKTKTTVGIDLGIKDLAILSDGKKYDNNRYLNNSLQRLKILQRRASRKKKGSANKKKANKKVAIQHEKITNQRKDYLHKISKELVNNHDTLVFETLQIKNMVKNRKLSRAISDAGWATLVDFCKYKCEWYGKNFIQIGCFEASTKLCNVCETKNQMLTLKDREWACATCGTIHDRDENAAKNIKKIGLKNYSGRGTSGESAESLTLVGAVKQ